MSHGPRGVLAAAVLLAQFLPTLADAATGLDDVAGPVESISFDSLLVPVRAAARHEQEQWQAPSAVSVITADEIRHAGYLSLVQALESLRSVYSAYDREYHYLGIRGFGIPGDYNNRILLQVDGARVNDAVYGSATVGTDFFLDMGLVKRIELARGPSSSMYGPNALFGVINIVPLEGRDLQGIKAEGDLGTNGYGRVHLAYGQRLKNGLDLLAAATYQPSRGAESSYYKELDSPATNSGWVRGLDREVVLSAFGQIAFKSVKLWAGFIDREKRVPTASYGAIFGDAGLFDHDQHLVASLQVRRTLPAALELTAQATFNYMTYAGEWPYDRRVNPEDPLLRVVNRDRAEGAFWSADIQLARRWLGWLRTSIGAEVEHDFRQFQANHDVAPYASFLDSSHSSVLAGVYLDLEAQLFKRLFVDVGARYDYYSYAAESAFNPRAALVYRFLPTTSAKAIFGTAFRGPNAFERFYAYGDPAIGNAQIINPSLKPERILTAEAQVEHWFGSRLRVQGSGYFYRMTDLIALQDLGDGVLQFHNVEAINAFGLEAEVEARLPWLRGRASYAYQRARHQSGQALINSPSHMAKLLAIAPLYRDQVSLAGDLVYLSPRLTTSGAETAPLILTGLTLYVRDLLPGLLLSVSARNLFDCRAQDPATPANVQQGFPRDGRSFWFRAGYRYSL
jgi:outer membrane receptor for ferrienterochelin and colicins